MATRVAINGFGRIGRMVFKCALGNEDIEFVGINDIAAPPTLAHLLKYDSVHHNSTHFKDRLDVEVGEDHLMVEGKKIRVLSEKDPAKLPWKELDVDVALESTGIFRHYEDAVKHRQAGAKKVVISAPAKGDHPVPTFVLGVNEKEYRPAEHHVVSNASCTTNCLAPVIKVLNERFGVKKGFLSTIHGYTAGQNIVDGPHKDLRRARAAAVSMVPTTTGATKAVALVIPEMKGKLSGMAFRIPIPDVSIIDVSAVVEKDTSAEEVNAVFKEYAEGELEGIVEYSDVPLVSADYTTNPASAVFDSLLTQVIEGNLIKAFAWYDNEWGYACRTRDLMAYMGERL